MEPITLALVAALIAPVPATRRPNWLADARPASGAPLLLPLDTDRPLFATFAPTEALLAPPTIALPPDLKVILAGEVASYQQFSDGWDGEGSKAATAASGAAAQAFLSAYPGGLPLPRPMISSEGHLGFYWDLDGGYADLSFDGDGLGSFFSRSKDGAEQYADGLDSAILDRRWAFASLGALSAPALDAA